MARRKLFTFKNKRHMPAWLAWLLAGLIKLVAATYRVTIRDPHEARKMILEECAVVVLWHNRILFMAPLVRKTVCRRSRVLISASRDGEYISTFIRRFGIIPVRGSSSRGGVQALLELCHVVKGGMNAVITVDGPRGPRYSVHPGAAAIARRCDVPIIPVSINAPSKWQLRSWDRMQIPHPFSKVELVFGAPRRLESDADSEEDGKQVKAQLMEITQD